MWPVLQYEDAQVVLPPAGLQPIMTAEDLSSHCTIIHLRARTLMAPSFLQEVGNRYYGIDMDLDSSKALEEDNVIMLLGFSRDKGTSAQCLLLRPSQHSSLQRVGRLRVWDINWDDVPYTELAIM